MLSTLFFGCRVLKMHCLAGSFVLLTALAQTSPATTNPNAQTPGKPSPARPAAAQTSSALRARRNVAATRTKREWGIEILGVHQVSAGYMLEFRYRVLDPKIARPLFDRKIKPYLLDPTTGATVMVPAPEKVGALRNVNMPEAGRMYWVMFANPGKMIKPGSRVSIHIGDFDSGNLIVN